ncbi:MAG: hypothetical protein WCA23_05145 [Stellaceae bacterium]
MSRSIRANHSSSSRRCPTDKPTLLVDASRQDPPNVGGRGIVECRARPVRGGHRAGQAGQRLSRRARCRPDSTIETFIACQLNVANWRWAGVPLYLRTGK